MSLVGWSATFASGRMKPILSMRRMITSPISVEGSISGGLFLEWVTLSSWSQTVFSVRLTTFHARSAAKDP